MSRFILAIAAIIFVPQFAFAQRSQQKTSAQQAVDFCEARYPGATSTARLQQVLCIQDQNIKILEARIKSGEKGLASDVEKLRKELETAKAQTSAPTPTSTGGVAAARAAIEKRANELKAKQPAVPQATTRPPLPPPPALAGGGVPFRVVPTPGQYAAATFVIDGPSLNVRHLGWALEQFVRGADQVRIVVRKNGVPIPIAQVNGNLGFVYADLNRDGRPDRMAYSAIDPSTTDEFWVASVGPRDRVEVIYLVPTGRIIEIPGLPPQILWGDPVRRELDRVPRLGRWEMDAHCAWPI